MLELVLLCAVAGALWFGLDSLKCRELAVQQARHACQMAGVQLLDDALATECWRLKRNEQGNLSWYRRYRFEFSSDGERRYQGTLSLLGHRLVAVQMEAYRMEPPAGELLH